MASVSCASLLMDPKDIAPVAKRFTISLAGSHFFDGDGFGSRVLGRAEVHEAAQGAQRLILFVDQVCEFLKRVVAVFTDRMLELADGLRIDQMIFAADAVLIVAADLKLGFRFRGAAVGVFVLHRRLAREHIQANAFETRGRAGEILVHQRFVQTDSFENLRAAITLQRGDAHLGEDLEQALIDGLLVVLQRRFKQWHSPAGRAARDLPASRSRDKD